MTLSNPIHKPTTTTQELGDEIGRYDAETGAVHSLNLTLNYPTK